MTGLMISGMKSSQNPARVYEAVQNEPTSMEETLVLLFQGAVKLLQDGRRHLSAGEYEQWHDCSVRTRRILSELLVALDTDKAPEVCEGLNALYVYIHRLITEAGLEEDYDKLQEAIDLLKQLADTWKEAWKECRRQKQQAA